ncbi:surface protease GP63 [Trypanosoma cruzi cruzi]|uniref:Leishmanolysin-like peptidase n=1 Tax=Trypanosoma cruzi TaxID=5693 RepID=A0A2V2UJF7_TRYCR|nr:surface protease GP63 [Trypanosoma cruzi cruzi]PWU84150.1 putative surface protease GP63 [Trypanosoma cruzi]
MRRFVSTVLLFLLWLAGGPCALAERRCIFDRVALNLSQLQTAVVQELPRGRAGAWQAYTVSTPDWAPIRIKVFAEDLKDTTKYCTVRGDVRSDFTGGRVLCRRQDVLTKEKMRIMVNRLLPEAVKLHTERLFVQPVSGVLRLPRFKVGVCGEFTVPIAHHLSGVVGADMLLYAAAAPTIGGTVAWASTCVTLQDGRPAAGVLNLGPSFIAPKRESIRVVSHEIAHALGFNSILMWRLGMISRRSDVRGKARTFVVDSNETLARAREHYDCRTAPGMELEDEGGEFTAYSHWERRNAKDELMSPLVGAGFYTALTMAFFSDMGFYRANFSMAEPMGWGYKAGCSLLQEKCMQNGVTAHPEMFCSDILKTPACTSDRRALGFCSIAVHDEMLSPEYQYFVEENVGGYRNTFVDFCPIIIPSEIGGCADGNSFFMPGSRVGPQSLCLKGNSLEMEFHGRIGDICAEVSCQAGIVRVRYLGNDAWHLCPEGASLTPKLPFIGGQILCPRAVDVCPQLSDKSTGESAHEENQDEIDTPDKREEKGMDDTSAPAEKKHDDRRKGEPSLLEKMCRLLGINCPKINWRKVWSFFSSRGMG